MNAAAPIYRMVRQAHHEGAFALFLILSLSKDEA
jgi:hypothetical protein